MPDLPTPTKVQQRLDVFVGRWHAVGESYAEAQRPEEPRRSALPWTSDESYEWLPGGFFLLHRWDARAGERPFVGTEIIGYDEAEGAYFTRFFDNAGFHPEYQASVDGSVWTFTEPETRATVTVLDGDRLDVRWEWRNGGEAWLPLCDRIATRVRAEDGAPA